MTRIQHAGNPTSIAIPGAGEPGAIRYGSRLSRACVELHYEALLDSFLGGQAAFVSDYYLAARHGPTPALVVELCDAHVWHRVDGGYRPSEEEAARFAAVIGDALKNTTGRGGRTPNAAPDRRLTIATLAG